MLGLGRAMGETIAAALVIGSSLGQITLNAFAARQLDARRDRERVGRGRRAAQVGADRARGPLFVITIVVNLVATAIVQRSMHAEPWQVRHPGDPILAMSLRPRRSWRTVKSTLMTGADARARSSLIALPLARDRVVARLAAALASRSRDFPDFFTTEIPIVSRRAGPGHGPRDRRHAARHRRRDADRGAARHPRRGLPPRVRRQGRSSRGSCGSWRWS